MSMAYKCDKCGCLYDKSKQNISVAYKQSKLNPLYITVKVAMGFDLCNKCVADALKAALGSVKIK